MKLSFFNRASIRQRAIVIAYVGRRLTIEILVYVVPCNLCSVKSVCQSQVFGCFGEHRVMGVVVLRGRSQRPRTDSFHVVGTFCCFKVINVCCSCFAYHFGVAGNKVCKLSAEIQIRRCFGLVKRKQIDQFCNQRNFLAKVHIHSPNGVARRLFLVVHFLSYGAFVQLHQGSSESEVFVYFVVGSQSKQALGYRTEHRVGFCRYGNRCSRIEIALVDNPNSSHCIIDSIVCSFGKCYSSCHYLYRTLGYVHRTERNLRSRRGFEPSFQVELVLIGVLLCLRLRKGVKRVKTILVGKLIIVQGSPQIFAKRLNGRKEYQSLVSLYCSTCGCGIIDKVEHSVGIHVLLIVHSVQAEHLQKRYALIVSISEISRLHSVFVCLIQNIQTKILFRNLVSIGNAIDILHHQFPNRVANIERRAFQQFYNQGIGI